MRSGLFLLSGFLMASAGYLLTRLFMADYPQAPALIIRSFAVLWSLIAGFNMFNGIFNAGYGWSEEIRIFLVIFTLPVVALAWAAGR